MVKELLFRSSSNELISLGDDKTIRFWDLDSGELNRTLRGEITDTGGRLYAGALSKDERYLAVGGFDAENSIRVIDLDHGEIAAVLRSHTNSVHALDFSDDGLWLASGSSDHQVLVWDLSELAGRSGLLEINDAAHLEAHEDSVYALDFSDDGLRLASGADDDLLILWKRESPGAPFEIVSRGTAHTDDVSALSFSPYGSLIISGGFDHRLVLWDGETGEFMETIDNDMGSSVNAVAFSPDGQRVLASSQSSQDGITAIYDLATSTRTVEFDQHDNRVRCAAWHPRKNLVATSGGNDNAVMVWRPSPEEKQGQAAATVVHRLSGEGRANWSVAFSEDRRGIVAFGRFYSAEAPLLDQDLELAFDFLNFEFVTGGDYHRAFTQIESITLEKTSPTTLSIGEDNTLEVNRSTDGTIHAYSFTPEGSGVIVGGGFSLKTFESNPSNDGGHPVRREFVGHQGEIWAVAASRDGEYLASASDDQTIRLWNLDSGELLASLFVADDHEWVCWTPSGHYHASPGGERYIGWHLNRGTGQLGDFFPSYVFRKVFHRPDIVSAAVRLGSVTRALAEAEMEEVKIDDLLPPRITWLAPERIRSTQGARTFTLRARLSSPGAELRELKLLLNGKAIHAYDLSDGTGFTYEEEIELNPGENRLSLYASNIHAGHTGEERVILLDEVDEDKRKDPDPDHPPESDEGLSSLLKPNLYMLAVGISDFEHEEISDLAYCDDDASAMAEFFEAQEGGLFAKTEIRLLTNGDATEAKIQEGLDWLEKSATQKDFVVLFLASHGMNDEKGKFYMIPHDCDPDHLRATAVAWEDFGEILGNLPSRVLMFLDTCHSGRLGANLFTMANRGQTRAIGGLKSAFDNSEAIRELTSDEVGVVIMAASTGNESSLENEEWGHGAFTSGVLSGLRGGADLNGDSIVHLTELDYYVAEIVKELTDGAQHPTTVKPSTISRLPVAAVEE